MFSTTTDITVKVGSPKWLLDLSKHFAGDTKCGLVDAANRLSAYQTTVCGILDDSRQYPQLKLCDHTKKRLERALKGRV